MRLGVAALEASVEEADDWVWMVDHSNQIGQEKALAVIGMRASNMPLPGMIVPAGQAGRRSRFSAAWQKVTSLSRGKNSS